MKRKCILLLILFFNQIAYGQKYEQIALEFYAEEILINQKKTKVFFDGFINPVDSQYQKLGELAIEHFYYCKVDPRGINNEKNEVDLVELLSILEQIKNLEFQSLTYETGKLNIPKPIKKRKKLKWRKLKGGIHYIAERFWYSIFPIKYNLSVEPAIKFEDNFYIWIKVSKNDLEYGNWFFIKLKNTEQVEDWCEISWVQ